LNIIDEFYPPNKHTTLTGYILPSIRHCRSIEN